mmetsp:Transcript_29041/g.78210  ORF Transcript_29041/g.78210 Transcript_29041/m.78210 type:complete len:283 (+) Transcript_29041:296-1144(+)
MPRPMPRPPMPRPRPMPLPPGFMPASAPSLLGLRTVSSTLRMRQAASVALWMALYLTNEGSHTNALKVSTTPPVLTSTPKFLPEPSKDACFCRNLLSTSVASNPALLHSWRGMTSRAFANARMNSWLLDVWLSATSRRYLLSSISIAPPPGTTSACFKARRTIMMASCNDRSASSMNCSLPPLSTMVAVLACGQPMNMLYRSAPTWRSSKLEHVPSTAGSRPLTVVCTRAPVALATRSMSGPSTRPAQKTPRSAKYCVPRSPIAKRDSTMLAPDATHLSSLS